MYHSKIFEYLLVFSNVGSTNVICVWNSFISSFCDEFLETNQLSHICCIWIQGRFSTMCYIQYMYLHKCSEHRLDKLRRIFRENPIFRSVCVLRWSGSLRWCLNLAIKAINYNVNKHRTSWSKTNVIFPDILASCLRTRAVVISWWLAMPASESSTSSNIEKYATHINSSWLLKIDYTRPKISYISSHVSFKKK